MKLPALSEDQVMLWAETLPKRMEVEYNQQSAKVVYHNQCNMNLRTDTKKTFPLFLRANSTQQKTRKNEDQRMQKGVGAFSKVVS